MEYEHSLRPVHEWHYPGAVTQVACSADGNRIALGGEAGSIEFWERTSQGWRRLSTSIFPGGEVPPFALSPDGEHYAVASPDGRGVVVRRVATGAQTASIAVPNGKAVVIAFSPHGEVTVGDERGWIHVWNWDRLNKPYPFKVHYKATLEAPVERPLKVLAWSPDGQVLTSSEEGDPWVCVYLYHEQTWIRTMLHRAVVPVGAIAWRPDSKRLAIAHGTEVEIRARQSRRKALVTCTGGHAEPITAVNWSPDGRFVLSLGKRGELCVWNAQTGELVGRLDGGEEDACSFTVVPGGQVLVGGRNWMAWLFDAFKVVGYRISGEESRELTSPLSWSATVCSGCLGSDDQRYCGVEAIALIEAQAQVCESCQRYLATGDPVRTGSPLRDFFAIDLQELSTELDIDAWTLGECWVSSQGLLRWIQTSGASAQLMIVEGTRPGSATRIPDHVVVAELAIDGISYCLDADGAAPTAAFLWKWHIVHGLGDIRLVPADEQRLLAAGMLSRPQISDCIADALHEQFGPWQSSFLSRFARSTGG